MKILLLIICIVLIPYPAHAEWFSWDKANTKLHVPLTLLMIADYKQTLYNEKTYYHNDGWDGAFTWHRESNKILGSLPSRSAIQHYFIASYATTTALVYFLPEKWSHYLQSGVIALELYVVENNYSLGAKIKF